MGFLKSGERGSKEFSDAAKTHLAMLVAGGWAAGQSEEFSDVAENQVNCWRETAAMPKKGKSGSKKGRQRWLMGDR